MDKTLSQSNRDTEKLRRRISEILALADDRVFYNDQGVKNAESNVISTIREVYGGSRLVSPSYDPDAETCFFRPRNESLIAVCRTNRWTRAAAACFVTSFVRRGVHWLRSFDTFVLALARVNSAVGWLCLKPGIAL